MADSPAESNKFFLGRISDAFYEFSDSGDITDKYIFATTLAAIMQLMVYLPATRYFTDEDLILNYLSLARVEQFIGAIKFFTILMAVEAAGGILLKILRKEARILVYFFCLSLVFSQVYILRYVGTHTISVPFFMAFDLTIILLFFGPKPGAVTFIFSSVLYLGVVLLEVFGYLTPPTFVLKTTTFNEIFSNKIIVLFSMGLAFSLFYLLGIFTSRMISLINQQNREIQQLMAVKDHFLSMVSHDLRTPMTSIKGYTSIMLDKLGKLDETRQKKYLTTISNESERLIRLVSDLLDLQRLDEGRMDFEFKDVEIVKLVNETIDSFQGAAFAKNIAIGRPEIGEEIIISADRDRLSQVIANLLSNSTKFTPDGGQINVNIEKSSQKGKPVVMVSVSDTGPGIPKESQSRLFDKFQQMQQESQKKIQGSGLGLALVKEIVEKHGGSVGVESEPGRGSTFYFTLKSKG